MSVNSQDFLDLASGKLTGNQVEICHRNTVSRAYYAAYHGCKDWLKQLPGCASQGDSDEGGVHTELINMLSHPAHEVKCETTRRLSKILAAQLKVFKIQRVKSDYFLNEENPYREWSLNSITQVELLLKKIGATPPKLAPADVSNDDEDVEKTKSSNISKAMPPIPPAAHASLKIVK
ncbi:hypothetical protein [Delftia acidovorans]|uniref:hypothetical protein n=1 Tax=Delftia acidovorans TaxID=80866 RepID=UPI002FDC8D59